MRFGGFLRGLAPDVDMMTRGAGER